MNRLIAFIAALLVAAPAFAANDDPPGLVGRLAAIEGEALVFTDPDAAWEKARVNAHLTSENSVWTEPRSRALVRAGSTALALDEATQLDIARLDVDLLQAYLARGSLAVRVRYFEPGDRLVIATREARFHLRANGRYRIDADAARGESRLTVFSGSARVETERGSRPVDIGRTAVVSGDRGDVDIEPAVETGIDDWARARDERIANGPASRYVSPRMTGWEDLDEYGEWRNEPEYGTVWVPSRVEADWAPYRYGRWTYVRPWGWTWVDDAPWGYAPFHYGRWVHVGGRWCWYPGRYERRPVWAPALVGWVGEPGWNITIGSGVAGAIGWYPLSPWDRYQPWYRSHANYVNRVNHVVIVNRPRPHHHYNRDYGATVVPREIFHDRRPVRDHIAHVPREVIARQPVTSGSAALANLRPSRPAQPAPSAGSAYARPTPGHSAPSFAPPAHERPGQPARPVEHPGYAPRPVERPAQAPRPVERPSPVPGPAVGPGFVPHAESGHRPAPSARPQVVPQPARPATPAAPASPFPPQATPAPSAPSAVQRPAEPSRPRPESRDASREQRPPRPAESRPQEGRPAPAQATERPATPRPAERPAPRAAEPRPAPPAERREARSADRAPAQQAPRTHKEGDKPQGEKPGRDKDK